MYAAILHLLGHPSEIYREPHPRTAGSVLRHSLVCGSTPAATVAKRAVKNVLYRQLENAGFHRRALKTTRLDF